MLIWGLTARDPTRTLASPDPEASHARFNGRLLMRPVLARETFRLVLCSPMQWTRETCELVGPRGKTVIDPGLVEWNYGQYEGVTLKQIHEGAHRAGWSSATHETANRRTS
jgi:broad specificity phosphatase PhoE